MREWVKNAGLCGCSCIPILLQPHAKALADFGIALKESGQDRGGNLGDARTRNGGNADGAAITQQVESACKVVSSLSVGDDALISLVASSACCCTTGYLHKTL